ncbi:CGNR zinc finger domain-containing protein [Catenulispora rubra]|uniref:CGNR zinc finger domain-containing protein n=1 Tax=Catenulispora rubra TaxID=280293 RepID=UPI001E294A20|nr:ABATE domain-containing protein [Catenulispora rubra]
MPEDATAREWMLAEEAVPIRLMATIWADVAGVHDDLCTADDLDAWLDATAVDRSGQGCTSAELDLARRLRDAVRRLAAQVTGDDREAARSATGDARAAVRDLNEVAAHLPGPRIMLADGVLQCTTSAPGSAVTGALARVAAESIALLGGPDADMLRACRAPGCVLYFVKTHPRREWCSVTCGNRVRAARRYEKVRSVR